MWAHNCTPKSEFTDYGLEGNTLPTQRDPERHTERDGEKCIEDEGNNIHKILKAKVQGQRRNSESSA